ncbi:SRPBCC family protein [Nocardioides sp.]|uniref:SRPBCC family protein n=1 Tax=Nocardioides sp. TaxID=35761 RepID=UPI0027273E44|nr:SRPBCC family protein [Nocardioides sp.]MDO9456270.1 SRPBCC family protein [Nocardioides sp.]
MSFDHAQTVTTPAPPSAVWALWADPATWPSWDPSVVGVVLDGPFEQGTAGTMTLAGPFEVPVVLAVVDPGTRYVDELTMGELVIRIDHVVTPLPDGGSEVTVSATIEGPGADDIGPMVTAEAPLALAALTAAAEAASA